MADLQVVCKALAQCQLSAEEVAYLQGHLASSSHPGQCFRLIEQAAGRPPCPDCGGHRCHRCGQANGLQRYRCVVCRRSFNALTGTPLAYLRLRHKARALGHGRQAVVGRLVSLKRSRLL